MIKFNTFRYIHYFSSIENVYCNIATVMEVMNFSVFLINQISWFGNKNNSTMNSASDMKSC